MMQVVEREQDEEARRRDIFRACHRFLGWNGPRPVREVLFELAEAAEPEEKRDFYGEGEIVQAFEREIADLLGKEDAALFPTGTMAQQVALRIWSDRAVSKMVAFHPSCHLETHEEKAYQALHGLEGRLVGDRQRLITLEDLEKLNGRIAALLIELPQREIGGQLPAWKDLVEQTNWARERGAALHMDGARLWESAPFYARSYQEIAALFDSVYVSFYKTLQAVAGAALAGPKEFIAEARGWRMRHGGDLFQFAPLAVSAREQLRRRLPLMDDYCSEARRIAALLRDLPRVRVRPDPPHTNMFHVFLEGDADELLGRAVRLAKEEKVCLFGSLRGTDVPGWHAFEMSVTNPESSLTDEEIRTCFEQVLAA